MKEKLIGGIVVLVIGGTSFAVRQKDVVNNFAEETGMSQQQAQQYVENSEDNLDSFSVIGKELVKDGNDVIDIASDIDCRYEYEWETSELSCPEGKSQLNAFGEDELSLGNCYISLDDDLGAQAKPKMSECIAAIDKLNSSLEMPITDDVLDDAAVTEIKNGNLYNKSVLRAALESE